MNILAIETGSTICQVGLQFKGERAYRQLSIRSHSQVILSLIDELLAESSIAKQDIDAIAVNHGPGSFTGIRVGVSAAQGLAYALDVPVYGVSSLEILALSGYLDNSLDNPSDSSQCLFTTIDARMSQIYCAWYHCNGASNIDLLGRQQVISPSQLESIDIPKAKANLAVLGSGLIYHDEFPAEYKTLRQIDSSVNLCSKASSQPEAELTMPAFLDIAEYRITTAEKGDLAHTLVEPVYLRNKVTG